MIRPLSRQQALENAAFLRHLRRTGNVHEAAREVGAHRAKFTKRRAKHPAFAAEWDAALAFAAARLQSRAPGKAASADEPRVVRTRDGRLQLREPVARQLTRKHEQAFLAALSATANVRLSAKAAGFSHSAFYARRDANPAFAREMRLAMEMGCERIEGALLESFDLCSGADDAWRSNDPPPIPSMTAAQALQLLYLHQKAARFATERRDLNRRRGELKEIWNARLATKWRIEQQEALENEAVAAAARICRKYNLPHEPPAPELPALDQVTGWSKADPNATPHDPTLALFGGWRLKE